MKGERACSLSHFSAQHPPQEIPVRSSSRQCQRTRTRAQTDAENWSLSEDEERLALAMRQEDPKVAKRIALPVLSSAVAKKSRHLEGRVLTLLAQCESLLANSGSAYELSSRALPVLQSVGDFREEAKAPAAAFDEVWHLVRPLDGSRSWAIAGIQPVAQDAALAA
jgi:hypothetical protein